MDRRLFLGSALCLAGCGYQPLYAPGSALSDLKNNVLVQAPTNRDEFDLVSEFEAQLGQPVNHNYRLKFDLSITEESAIIDASQELQRFNVNGVLTYYLSRHDKEQVAQGEVKAFTAYSATGSTVATSAARADARRRLMTTLAERALTHISATAQI